MEPSVNLKDTISKLIIEHKFIVDKGWKNGYHIHLRGSLDDETLNVIVSEIKEGISDSLTQYKDTEFIKKYEPVAKVLNTSNPFKPIFKGEVIVNMEDSIYENDIEDTLFREANHIFDLYFCRKYFNENSLYQVIEETMKFHNMLEADEEPESTDALAYNCHLSHYVAFINRLNEQDKESIEEKFKLKFEEDLEEGLLEFNLSATALTEDLMNFHRKISSLVKSKQLNFYMPFTREHLDEKLKFASQRHQQTLLKGKYGKLSL